MATGDAKPVDVDVRKDRRRERERGHAFGFVPAADSVAASVFPGQPEQQSHGLYVKVLPDGNVVTRPFGDGTGMQVWAEIVTGAGVPNRPIDLAPAAHSPAFERTDVRRAGASLAPHVDVDAMRFA